MPIPMISVDDHVVEPAHLFREWLPRKYRARGPYVQRLPYEHGWGFKQFVRPAASGPEADCWIFGEIAQFISCSLVAADLAGDQIDVYKPRSFHEMRPGFYEPRARLEDMDIISVERSLCFPNCMRFCGQMFLWMAEKDPELALACVRAYNDWMVEEWCGDSGGRLIPLCVVPLWDASLAAEEVRRNAARGVRAVTFTELPAALGLPSLHDAGRHWLPLIEACHDTSTVLCMHIGSSSTIPTSAPDAPPGVMAASTSFNAQLALADWLLSGWLARYPRLRLAFSESQIGWIPFVLERVDWIWQQRTAASQLPKEITAPPSSYMSDRVFGCFFADSFGISVRNAVGTDLITFESDYPHQDSLWPNTSEYIRKALTGVDDTDVYKILRGNALKMLDLSEDLVVR
jgi:predicted TIM-barrel fold metal-dependent hydrolase